MIRRLCTRDVLSKTVLKYCAFMLCLAWQTQVGAATDFYRDVYPILKSSCISCHNKTITEGSLNLESPEFAIKGGDSGAGVLAGKAEESLIYQASTQSGDVVMPPKNNKTGAEPLSQKQLAVLAAWINEGAKTSVRQKERTNWQPVAKSVQPVYCAAVTEDGRWAACGRANQLDLYDLATLQFRIELTDPACAPGKGSAVPGLAHHSLVQCVAFAPDGNRLASGSDREVKLWKRSPSIPPRTTVSPIPDCIAATLSQDAQILACLNRQGVLTVSNTAGKRVQTKLTGVEPAAVPLLSISPDKKTIAIPSTEMMLTIWDLKSRRRMWSIKQPTDSKLLVWTADSQSIVVAGTDGVVRAWQLPTDPAAQPGEPRVFRGGSSGITGLTIMTNPDRIAVTNEQGQGRIWRMTDKDPIQEFQTPPMGSTSTASEKATLAAIALPGGVIRVVNFQSGKTVAELTGDPVIQDQMATLNLKLERQQLEQAFHKAEVSRMEEQNKDLENVMTKARETIETATKVSPDKQKALQTAQEAEAATQKTLDEVNTQLQAAEAQQPADENMLKQIQDRRKTAMKSVMEAKSKTTTAMNTLRESQNQIKDANVELERATAIKMRNIAAIATAKQKMTETQKEVDQVKADLAAAKTRSAEKPFRPVTMAFSPDGQMLTTIDDTGDCRIWAVATASPIFQLAVPTTTSDPQIVSPSDGSFVICLKDGSGIAIDLNTRWSLEKVIGGDAVQSPIVDRVNAIDFSPDGKLLAVGSGAASRSGEIRLWDVESGELVSNWEERHADSVLSLSFSPDGQKLASGGADRLARITELASGKVTAVLEGHTHHVMGVSFRTDERELATAGADGVVLIWDMQSGERKKKIEGWSKEVTALQFLGATSQVVTSAGDQQIRIVNDDGTQVRAINNLPEFMHTVATSRCGKVIVGGGQDGILRVWDASNGKELARFSGQ